MGRFLLRTRGEPTSGPEAGVDRLERVRLGLPLRFEAVGEALASGTGSTEACAVAGTAMAKDGASLDETLDALRTTYELVVRTTPAFDDIQAVARAWADAALAHLHQLACEDPITGLASLAHVRSRLSELYRGHGAVRDTHGLVVGELPSDPPGLSEDPSGIKYALNRSMRLGILGDTARTVFPGTENIGRLGPDRIVVLAERDHRLGRRVALLRRMTRAIPGAAGPTRVWIEGLPGTDAVAALLLDELARS